MTLKMKVNLLGFFTVFFWAAAFPFSKIALYHFSPNSIALFRCGIASFLLCAIGIANKIALPKKKDIPKFFLSGFVGFFLYLVFFNAGIHSLTSATSSIIIATTPIITAIASAFLFSEKIETIGWIAIAFEFLGIVTLSLWNGDIALNRGIVWTLIASIVFAAYNLYQKQLFLEGYSSYEIVTYSLLCGTILLMLFLPQGLNELSEAPNKPLIAVLFMGIFSSAIAFSLWSKAISLAEKISDVTNFMFVTPLLSTILGFVLLKEIPSAGTFVGGIMIMIGLLLFQFGTKLNGRIHPKFKNYQTSKNIPQNCPQKR